MAQTGTGKEKEEEGNYMHHLPLRFPIILRGNSDYFLKQHPK
jgi:hypothetical protein